MRSQRLTWGYGLVLLGSFLVSVLLGWLPIGTRVDGDAYDWFFRLHPPQARSASQAIVLAIDEDTLSKAGGVRRLRTIVLDSLQALIPARTSAIAIDVSMFDEGDPAEDARLAAAICSAGNVVLAAELTADGSRWQVPAPGMLACAAAVGHVHSQPDPVNRSLALELAAGRQRFWAMSLEALRVSARAPHILEEPEGIKIGELFVPAVRRQGRLLNIRYVDGAIPVIPAWQIQRRAAECQGKAVFLGVTAVSAARDRLMTPFDRIMTGVEIHAQAFETMRDRQFLLPAPLTASVGAALFITLAAGAIFAFLGGWMGYSMAALLIAASHALVHLLFRAGIILPYTGTLTAAWLGTVSAASWQYFVVRRQLFKAEHDRARYQEAVHFVTHEMRSPLTAIQGSSELMGRYALNEDKRRQIAGLIHSESKRLAKMIQTFLDLERLSSGNMEVRTGPVDLAEVVRTALQRAQPLAERKSIDLKSSVAGVHMMSGDRELMEYAVYNLLTNAIKYSPAETAVTVAMAGDSGQWKLSVLDQGMGMDATELRQISKRFYRTKKAEASGEAGTGIGLSIVRQILIHHGGRMEVTSEPGKGSCFTIVLPRSAGSAPVAPPSN